MERNLKKIKIRSVGEKVCSSLQMAWDLNYIDAFIALKPNIQKTDLGMNVTDIKRVALQGNDQQEQYLVS